MLTYGSIDPSLVIDHKCRVRCCVNVNHLRLTTVRENNFAPGSLSICKPNLYKKLCPYGHPYDRLERGFRICSKCISRKNANQRSRLKRLGRKKEQAGWAQCESCLRIVNIGKYGKLYPHPIKKSKGSPRCDGVKALAEGKE